eukprot:m.342520 g.342520  ORF g.342520 m.342520 type:complete len:191 (-) comp21472_c0_seq1:72-644(-)
MATAQLSVFLFVCFVAESLACSPIRGWKPPTIEEEARYAAVVLEGVITGLSSVTETWVNDTATVKVTNYYAGCGPSIVNVTGFSDPAACGVLAEMNATYFLYLCANEFGAEYRLNTFDIHTGAIPVITKQINEYDVVKAKTISVTGPGATPDVCKTQPLEHRNCSKPDNSAVSTTLSSVAAVFVLVPLLL